MEPFLADEDTFLNRLASRDWRPADAPAVVKAWKHFGDGYQHYPLTNLFQYYGPMHDGPVWPLLLKPADAPLAPTWLLGSTITRQPWPPSGDRIGESFREALTLDETAELARRMSAAWDRGVEILRGLEPRYAGQAERLLDIGVARALGIQFRTGYNILRFYSLREKMFRTEGVGRLSMLETLSGIVREELQLNERLLELCARDSRLGFHSEAEGYKYYPEKIRWRMGKLRGVLNQDVPELKRLIQAGKPLFPEYTGAQPEGAVATSVRSDGSLWSSPELAVPSSLRWQPFEDGPGKAGMKWAATHDARALYIVVSSPAPLAGVQVKVEPRRLWPARQFVFTPGGPVLRDLPDRVSPQSVEGRMAGGAGGARAVVRIPLDAAGLAAARPGPIRVDVRVRQSGGAAGGWRPLHPLTPRLNLGADNPADLGWLVFEPPAGGAAGSGHRLPEGS